MFTAGGFRILPCAFRDCLFEVMPKMAYEATMTLDAMKRGETERPGARNQNASSAASDGGERAVGDLKFKKRRRTPSQRHHVQEADGLARHVWTCKRVLCVSMTCLFARTIVLTPALM